LAATRGLRAAASSKAETGRHNYADLGICYFLAELQQVRGRCGRTNIPRKNIWCLDILARDVDLLGLPRRLLEIPEQRAEVCACVCAVRAQLILKFTGDHEERRAALATVLQRPRAT